MGNPPSVAGWWRCCVCDRETNPEFNGETCPDCNHQACFDCTGSIPSQSIRPHPVSRNQLLAIALNFKLVEGVYADTGSQTNCISEAYARFLEVRVIPGVQIFKLPIRGFFIESIGTAQIRCRFLDPPFMPRTCQFFVFPTLSCNAILGNKFLRDTKTLDVFRSRLKDSSGRKYPSSKSLGTPQDRISCWLGMQLTWALPDTGATLNLISLRLAAELGYNDQSGGKSMDSRTPITVELADGTELMTCGLVSITVSFRDPNQHRVATPVPTFKLREGSKKSKPENSPAMLGPLARVNDVFHVVDGLEPDVILGDPLLNSVQAYSQHSANFKTVATTGPLSIAFGGEKKKKEHRGPPRPQRTDVEVLGDEFSVVSDELEQEQSNLQLRFAKGEIDEPAKQRLGYQAEQKYNNWLRANRERIVRHWDLDWYLSKIPQEMG